MSLKSQAMIFAAGFVVCLAILLPFVFKFNQPVADVSKNKETIFGPGSPPVASQDPSGPKSDFRTATPSKKGWATTLAPIYTIGIFLYLIYIVHRILSQRKNNESNRAATLRKKRKTQISGLHASQLQQLEKEIDTSQKAVEAILQKAHVAMSKAYQEVSSSSSLSDSYESDHNEAKLVELSEGTTSSANNDSHQDSSSSSPSEKVTVHRRKTHHRRQQSFADESSTSSSGEKEGYFRSDFITESSSSALLDEEEDTSSRLEFSSENGGELGDILNVAYQSSSVTNPPYVGDSIENRDKDGSVEEVTKHGADETLGKDMMIPEGATKKTSPRSRKKAENQRLLEDKEKLRQTTRKVLTAMEEIKDFIKDQKK